ncbi:hypothetical protein FMEAI12_3220053 [Parafrankia sp. Ea1.12]|nr:hypothetical protein FMEAI12_3220053 [Parafrankia sp. Ea1.12]
MELAAHSIAAPPNLARLRCPARSKQAGPDQERR